MDELRRFKSLKFDLRTCSKENFGDVTRQKKIQISGEIREMDRLEDTDNFHEEERLEREAKKVELQNYLLWRKSATNKNHGHCG